MNPVVFDAKGFLKPYEKTTVSLDFFKEFFVERFPDSESRSEIFEDYLKYKSAFRKQISPQFTHWINGSFVTNTLNPKDIDIVTFVDFEIFDSKSYILEPEFGKFKSKEKFKFVDAYLIKNYPKSHKRYFVTEFDSVYWKNWFSKSKKDWRKQQFPKGFIEIKFE